MEYSVPVAVCPIGSRYSFFQQLPWAHPSAKQNVTVHVKRIPVGKYSLKVKMIDNIHDIAQFFNFPHHSIVHSLAGNSPIDSPVRILTNHCENPRGVTVYLSASSNKHDDVLPDQIGFVDSHPMHRQGNSFVSRISNGASMIAKVHIASEDHSKSDIQNAIQTILKWRNIHLTDQNDCNPSNMNIDIAHKILRNSDHHVFINGSPNLHRVIVRKPQNLRDILNLINHIPAVSHDNPNPIAMFVRADNSFGFGNIPGLCSAKTHPQTHPQTSMVTARISGLDAETVKRLLNLRGVQSKLIPILNRHEKICGKRKHRCIEHDHHQDATNAFNHIKKAFETLSNQMSHLDNGIPSKVKLPSICEIHSKYPTIRKVILIGRNGNDDIGSFLNKNSGFTLLHPGVHYGVSAMKPTSKVTLVGGNANPATATTTIHTLDPNSLLTLLQPGLHYQTSSPTTVTLCGNSSPATTVSHTLDSLFTLLQPGLHYQTSSPTGSRGYAYRQ